ncbi:choice-of-anchor Q domain-containing protein [Salmonirosea aquatica]|uniref:DUF1565 domain-containing protein n=1 Tax=Salmonirosea aquatica TaxID=2654236 RepID=A0A7C9F5G7_9BACT|nr:hypothetical protein [Cytophagaceae bacterium SJW1-29]
MLTNCSFLNNTAYTNGGGMFNEGSSPTLTNCVLFGSGGQNTIFNFDINSTLTANYTLFEASESDYTGSNNLTTTASPFISTNSTELRSGSPAIDAGNNAAYNGPATDLAGNPRTVGGRIDMGAYEFQGTVPQTRYVNAARPNDNGDGLTWATARKYLQTALADAQSGDQIWVAQGTYKPTTVITDRLASFIMKEGVKIYGGFTSGQINLADRNTNPATNGTVLSGEIDNVNGLTGNSYHVVFNDQNGLTAAAVLDGFTIAGGNADGASSPNTFGAGMYNDASSPTLANCSFLNNSAGIGGASTTIIVAPRSPTVRFGIIMLISGGRVQRFQ